jgi:alpha-beta hydrolase superfamily lysophospholipase
MPTGALNHMQKTTHNITMSDGKKVFVRRWEGSQSNQNPTAIIQVVHGMAEHSARYERLAERMTKHGYTVYAHDHRGHGFTAQSPKELGHFADRYGWRLVIEDVKTVNELIRSQHPDLPVIVMGHSMGSFILQKCLTKYPDIADAVMLSGSTLPNLLLVKAAKALANYDKNRQGPRARCRSVDFLTFYPYNKAFRPNRTEADWLSRDTAVVDDYIRDERCGFVGTHQMWADFSDGLLELFSKDNHSRLPKDIPYLIFSGDRDPVGSKGKGVKKLYNKIKRHGVKSVQLKLYRDGRHEMLNEINHHEVEKDVLDWLRRYVIRPHAQQNRAA